jgi:hypothetical protein
MNKKVVLVKAMIVVGFMGVALALSSLLSNTAPATIGFTQQQVDEKIKASIAPIQAKLDEANKTIARLELRHEN